MKAKNTISFEEVKSIIEYNLEEEVNAGIEAEEPDSTEELEVITNGKLKK